jgi:hypothetical protein
VTGALGTAAGDSTRVDVALFPGAAAAGEPIFADQRYAIDGRYRVQLPKLGEGVYTARVRQSDAAGHEAVVDRTFRVDTTRPVPVLEAPVAGAQLSDRRPVFSGRAGTAPGDAPAVAVTIVSSSSENIVARVTLPVVDGRFAGPLDRDLRQGSYRARVSQRDAAGNWPDKSDVGTSFEILPPPVRLPTMPVVPIDLTAPTATLPQTIARKGRQLAARLKVSEKGEVDVSLRLGRAVIAKESVLVREAGRLTVKLELSRKALARLRRTRKPLTLVVRATDGAGNARTVKRTVKLAR